MHVKDRLARLVPNPVKARLGSTYWSLKTTYWSLSEFLDPGAQRQDLIPPKSLIASVGGLDFQATGQEFKRYFIELCGLQPDQRVLDVGCGVGRMALPLTGYISERGEYWGFDPGRRAIRWCQQHVTPQFPNFHFQHSDVFNRAYNRGGRIAASEYTFPYPDNYFDFAFLTSVFTHMLLSDVEHYLGEVARVLRPGGICCATFFLLDETALGLVAADRSKMRFVYRAGGGLTIDKGKPETAIAFYEKTARDLYERSGIEILEPIRWGAWSGRDPHLSWQDLILARKL